MSHTTLDARKRAAEDCPVVNPDADRSVIVEPIDLAAAIIRLAKAVEKLAPDDGKRDYVRTLTGEDIRAWSFTPPPDPPARDWLVPATQMEALREAFDQWLRTGSEDAFTAWVDETNAVLDAAREVEHE